MSNQVETLNENIGNFEGRLVGIEDNVRNISNDLESMKSVHNSGNSALKNTLEKSAKTFKENIHQVQNEMKNMSESSANLEMGLKKSQELSKNLDDKLMKSQVEQKESNEELKKLHEESSKEIQDLKKTISELMALLKNERNNSNNQSEIIEIPNRINSEKELRGTVSNAKTCIPPAVMTSPIESTVIVTLPSVAKRTLDETKNDGTAHSTPDPIISNNIPIKNLDISAAQVPMEDQVQISNVQAETQAQNSTSEIISKKISKKFLRKGSRRVSKKKVSRKEESGSKPSQVKTLSSEPRKEE